MSSTFAQQRRRAGGPSRPSRLPPQPQSRHGGEDPLDLPPYEPPRCPLTSQAQQALKELSTSRAGDRYETGLDASARLLSRTVYAINERLTNRKRLAGQMAERVAKRGKNNNNSNNADGGEGGDSSAAAASVERAEAAAAELGAEVSGLTAQVEQAMREVLDMQAALQDERAVLGGLPDLVAERQEDAAGQARRDHQAAAAAAAAAVAGGDGEDEDQDGEDQDPPEVHGVPVLDILQGERDAKAAEYGRLGPYQRYALNNSYVDFKRSWHQGLYPDEEVPVPDATKWFDRDGRPRHATREDGRRQDGGGGGGVGDGEEGGEEEDQEDDSDDDVQIAREKRSFICPLSLSTMEEPYTCGLCKHSFERRFIVEYIKGPNKRGQTAKCPIPGCHVDAMSINDLYLDEALLRRMKRAAQAAREEQERSSDQEEEEEEEQVESMAVDTDIKGEAGLEEDD